MRLTVVPLLPFDLYIYIEVYKKIKKPIIFFIFIHKLIVFSTAHILPDYNLLNISIDTPY